MRLLLVYGTRPEAIKLMPLARLLRRASWCRLKVCCTGQHRELLRGLRSSRDLDPDLAFSVMRPGQTPGELMERVQTLIDAELGRVRPDLLIVQGDTTSGAAAALAAFYRGIPVVHVEAGLRTGDFARPFPEEGNRVLIDRVASLHLAPTSRARKNLLKEGVSPASIVVTGNTVVDALLAARKDAVRHDASAFPFLLATIHRRETFGAPLRRMLKGVRELVEKNPPVHLLLPTHPNPRVRGPVRDVLRHPRIHLLPPTAHNEQIALLKACRFVLTDSGGLQEEAPHLGKPILILREKTERPEGIAAGAAKLVGFDPAKIVREGSKLLRDKKAYAKMAKVRKLYGDGKAARRSVAAIKWFLGSGPRPKDW